MTKKDYIIIAKWLAMNINHFATYANFGQAVQNLAVMLQQDNHRFNGYEFQKSVNDFKKEIENKL